MPSKMRTVALADAAFVVAESVALGGIGFEPLEKNLKRFAAVHDVFLLNRLFVIMLHFFKFLVEFLGRLFGES